MNSVRKQQILEKLAGRMRDFVVGAINARAAGKETAEQAVAARMQHALQGIAQRNAYRRKALAEGDLPDAALWAEAKRKHLANAAPAIKEWKDLVAKNRETRKKLSW